jgi:hypothetical protein
MLLTITSATLLIKLKAGAIIIHMYTILSEINN